MTGGWQRSSASSPGTVSVYDGSTSGPLLDTQTLAGGQASSQPIATLALGGHTIVFAYSGDADAQRAAGQSSPFYDSALGNNGFGSNDDVSVTGFDATGHFSFTPAGLLPGLNVVPVRTIDNAGNFVDQTIRFIIQGQGAATTKRWQPWIKRYRRTAELGS